MNLKQSFLLVLLCIGLSSYGQLLRPDDGNISMELSHPYFKSLTLQIVENTEINQNTGIPSSSKKMILKGEVKLEYLNYTFGEQAAFHQKTSANLMSEHGVGKLDYFLTFNILKSDGNVIKKHPTIDSEKPKLASLIEINSVPGEKAYVNSPTFKVEYQILSAREIKDYLMIEPTLIYFYQYQTEVVDPTTGESYKRKVTEHPEQGMGPIWIELSLRDKKTLERVGS